MLFPCGQYGQSQPSPVGPPTLARGVLFEALVGTSEGVHSAAMGRGLTFRQSLQPFLHVLTMHLACMHAHPRHGWAEAKSATRETRVRIGAQAVHTPRRIGRGPVGTVERAEGERAYTPAALVGCTAAVLAQAQLRAVDAIGQV